MGIVAIRRAGCATTKPCDTIGVLSVWTILAFKFPGSSSVLPSRTGLTNNVTIPRGELSLPTGTTLAPPRSAANLPWRAGRALHRSRSGGDLPSRALDALPVNIAPLAKDVESVVHVPTQNALARRDVNRSGARVEAVSRTAVAFTQPCDRCELVLRARVAGGGAR